MASPKWFGLALGWPICGGGPGAQVPGQVPLNLTPPTISGAVYPGAIVSGDAGTWAYGPVDTYLTWHTAPALVGPWTELSGPITEDNAGEYLRATVIAINDIGTSLPAYSNVLGPIAAEAPVTEVAVGPLWTGPANSGGTPPNPAPAIAARLLEGAKQQPAVNILFAHSQIILDDIWLPVQVELIDGRTGSVYLGRNRKVSARMWVEGTWTTVSARTVRTGVDARGRPWSVKAFWFKLKMPDVSAITTIAPGGEGARINVFIEGVPEDTAAFDTRTVGPFPFFPRKPTDIVTKRVHKTAGIGDATTLLAAYSTAPTEFTSSGKAVEVAVVDHDKMWAPGRMGTENNAIPWLTKVYLGLDHTTGLKCDGQLGDPTAFPSQGYSSPSLNRLWWHGWKHDVGKTGGLQARTVNNQHMVCTDHETFCTSFPAGPITISGVTYTQYGTGTGSAALLRGRQASGKSMKSMTGADPYFVSINGYYHDLPSFALVDCAVACNNHVDNVSGSAIENSFGGTYGGTIKRFGGFYSNVLNRADDGNPGMRVAWTVGAKPAFFGIMRTGNVGGDGEFTLWYGTDRADAEAAGARFSWPTVGNKPIATLVAEINATVGVPITATDISTDFMRLDCTHLSQPGLSASQPLAEMRDVATVSTPFPYEVTGTSIDCNVLADIHANGYAHALGVSNRVNLSMRDVSFTEYCGAGEFANNGGTAKFIDLYVTGCVWWNELGYTNKHGNWQAVGAQRGRFIGNKDGAGIAHCVFANGGGIWTESTQTSKDAVVGYSYGDFGNFSWGVKGTGLVTTTWIVPTGSTNSKALLTAPSVDDYDDRLTFVNGAGGNFQLLPNSNTLLPDLVNTAGKWGPSGQDLSDIMY